MPIVTVVVAAYVAGLVFGFGVVPESGQMLRWVDAHLALLLSAAATGVSIAGLGGKRLPRGRIVGSIAAAVTFAGVVVARTRVAGDAACARRAAAAHSWRVVLDDSARPGESTHGTVVDGGCRVRLAMVVARGEGEGGDVVLAFGAAERGPNASVVVREARLLPDGGTVATVRLRARAGRSIDALFGGDAPLVRALVIADQRAIPADVRDRFAASGVVHMIAVAGLHVAIVAGAVMLVLRAARGPRGAAVVAGVIAIVAYVAIIGAPAAALRSASMMVVTATSRLLQRPTSRWSSLSLGAAVPLVDARAVLTVGYQLSIAGMAAVIAAGAVRQRVLRPRLRGWALHAATGLVVSTIATAVTSPWVAWWFGRVSLVAPVTNLLAAPVVALLQPLLFLALALAPLPAAAAFVAGAAHPLLVVFEGIATVGAALPVAAITVSPTLAAATLAGGAAIAGVVACVSRSPTPWLIVAGAALVALIWLPLAPVRLSGTMELHVIDVGQGDAIAVRTPRGRWILFDAGRSWPGGDAGRTTVLPYLRRRGGTLAAFVLSHPHADHVGGATTVFHGLRPDAYYDAAFAGGSEPYAASLAAARALGVPWHRVHPGDSLAVDGVAVHFLAPDSAWTVAMTDPNVASTVARVDFGAVRFLLVGDAERAEEQWLVARAGDALRADVLKVGHHGSGTSSTPRFLDAVRPRIALVSVGAGNRYHLPTPSVMAALADRGMQVLRTDDWGSIVVETDGVGIAVAANGDRWELGPPRSSPP
ncbi:MAG: hypothetical protein NVS1B4_13970 [Gemmatimonadaceae bacterium]